MKRTLVTVIFVGTMAGFWMGCSNIDADPQGLELAVTDSTMQGTFQFRGETLEFESVSTDNGAVEVTISLHDMTLTATVEPSGAVDLDAFADENGEDTQMTEEDRIILRAFVTALYAKMDHADSQMANYLIRVSEIWSGYSGTEKLQTLILGQEGRSYTSLCGYVNRYWRSTHDGPWLIGCNTDNWDDKTTYYGYISNHSDAPCSDGTWFHNGSGWQACGNSHSKSLEYAYGGCFGQCGEGCGSADYTVDCANHDSCVRHGDHAMWAGSCSDELSFTLDDVVFAPICN